MAEPALPLDEAPTLTRISSFEGGSNQYLSAEELPANQARFIYNGCICKPPHLHKAHGYTLLANNSDADRIVGASEYKPFGSLPQLFREREDAVIERLEPGASTWDTSKSSGLNPNLNITYLQIRNELYRLSQVNPCWVYDGQNWVEQGINNTSVPQGNLGLWFKGIFFVGGNLNNPDHLFFSSSGAPKTFDRAVNAFKVSEGDNSIMTGLAPFRQSSVIIGKYSSIHELIVIGTTPLTDWKLQPVDTSHGMVCPPYAASANRVFYIGSDKTIREMLTTQQDTSIARPEPLSKNIPAWIDAINWDDQKAMRQCRLITFDNKLFVSVPMKSAKKPDTLLVLDLLTGGWVLWENFPVADFTKTTLNGREVLVFHSNTTASTFTMFKGKTYAGTNIDLRLHTRAYPADGVDGTREGAFQECEIVAEATESATFSVKGRVDNGRYESTVGDYTTLVNESDAAMDLSGSHIDSSSSLDAPFNCMDGHLIREKFNIDGKIDPNTGKFIEYLIEESTSAEVRISRISTRALVDTYGLQEDKS